MVTSYTEILHFPYLFHMYVSVSVGVHVVIKGMNQGKISSVCLYKLYGIGMEEQMVWNTREHKNLTNNEFVSE